MDLRVEQTCPVEFPDLSFSKPRGKHLALPSRRGASLGLGDLRGARTNSLEISRKRSSRGSMALTRMGLRDSSSSCPGTRLPRLLPCWAGLSLSP